ncbi:MAG: c-type cytochrome biogenesis protein CcmF [Betaproteobacteria bacterium 13_1_40CM_4_64_4]|nr:MAG: c-type cytochrome biogenesis protein CcmF [Betaproteobacteria bacterium 13_1_40CM_4_64_4]
MIPELGHFALILALLVAVAQSTLPLAGAANGEPRLMALARPAARAQFLLVVIAFACLAAAFVGNDFSVQNVATNSNSELPLHYRFAATWGSHEGSLLLWTLMLAGWTFAVTLFSRNLPPVLLARVIAVMGWVSVGFLLFLLFTSNPFDRLVPPAPEGRDLNPLLQDPGMVIHPPMLYMGYVGFSVAFAFAIAALLGGRLDATWARWSRPWTTVAWAFLTIGIALGSGWAYYTLGWGGWWFWDPVENASFMPWLTGTALIHSLAVTEKRGAFKSWTVLLAILAFSLSLLGTFLVRSGVLTSVHAFATDPARGVFILAFLALVVGGSLTLFAWRAGKVGLGGIFGVVSRESTLLANNILLIVAMASVLLGTLYPLFLDALNLGKISVGPPYFDAVFYPLLAPAVFLMGVGPMARWSKASLPDLWTRLKWALAVAVVAAVILPLILGRWSPLIAAGLFLALWVVVSSIVSLRTRLAGSHRQGLIAKLAASSSSYYGMLLAHLGVAVFIVGVTLVKGYESEQDVRLDVGQSIEVGGYAFKFLGVAPGPGPNYRTLTGSFEVRKGGRLIETLKPEKRIYNASGQAMTIAAIDIGLLGDRYVSLGEPLASDAIDGAWGVRIYLKPFIDWIWAGALLMALGGFVAVCDRRYRLAIRSSAGAIGSAAGSGAPAD